MQQLQKPILNKIQPGLNPIFIISPNRNDGDALALLLSNYFSFKKDTTNTNENFEVNKNFFSTNETLKIPYQPADPKNWEKDELKATLKLIIDEGFDSKKLWGLQLDYEFFFELQLNDLFPNAFFIFLYGPKITKFGFKESDKNYTFLKKVYDFHSQHKENTVLIHSNNVIYTPSLVLKALPIHHEIVIRDISAIDEINAYKATKWQMSFAESEQVVQLKKLLEESNLINERNIWFEAKDVLFLLIISENADHDCILRKIQQLSSSFSYCPETHIICKNEQEKRLLQKLVEGVKKQVTNITITACHSNISTSLNELIQDSKCSYIVIDNLTLTYSLVSALAPFRKQIAPSFIFGNIEINRINTDTSTKLSLIDILTIRSIPLNISFSKNTWHQINGFDNALENKVTIWDFSIRALELPDNYALETEALNANPDLKYDVVEKSMIPYEGYKTIIEKHKYLFEEKLNQVIKIFSENQYLPQHEIVKLKTNISSLNLLLSHSKDELRSLNELKDQLQHKISLLESKWYNRLARKLAHFKRIFFKAKTPKKGGILKFLKFFVFAFTKPGFKIIRKFIKGFFKKLYLISEDRPIKIVYLDDNENIGGATFNNYHDWIVNKLKISALRHEYNDNIGKLTLKPKISIIMPVYNPPAEFLKAAIESVISQLYGNWELCIADDCSTNPVVHRLINSYCFKDKRIKAVFRKENGHISACSNSALDLATGDYILCLDHDDLLTPNCTFEVLRHINNHPEDDIIYSDEDKIDDRATYSLPYFKPDWAPDNLLAKNYITHIAVYKKELINKLGGYRIGFEGSQDYDLILRGTELTTHIGHIPKVLYHWRIHSASAAQQIDIKPYAFIAAKKALEEALVRRNTPGEVKYLSGLMGYRIKYYISSYDKVSIIIPTKDQAKLMRNTIESLISLTDYPNYEILVLNNNSNTEEFSELMKEFSEKYKGIFRCLDATFPFNFSKLMNVGAAETDGKFILLLNNDVEIIHADWLSKMVSYAQHKQTGAVGVKLLYPDDKIQSAGTVIGLGGVAGHVFVNFFKDDPGYFSYLQSTTNYSAITAACLMLRRDIFEEVGGMDEYLEVEFNDVDFCLKILDKGYYNVYLPDVVLYHYESATRGHPHQNKVSYERHLREVNYFLAKWEKYIKKDPFYNPNLRYDVQDFRTNFNA